MKSKFIPQFYKHELFRKLQHLFQGEKSVDEYNKEMNFAMIKAEIEEDKEATMARFIRGLNK